MAVTDRLEGFLRAEEAANRLVEELTRLSQVTQSYVEADRKLVQASDDLRSLVVPMGNVAQELSQTIKTLREIDTGSILAGQVNLQQRIDLTHILLQDVQRATAQLSHSTIDAVQQQSQVLQSSVKQSLVELQGDLGIQLGDQRRSIETFASTIRSVESTTNTALAENRKELSDAQQAIRKIRTAVYATIALSGVGIAIEIARIFVH